MRFLVPLTAALSYLVDLVIAIVWPTVTALLVAVTLPFDRNRAVAGRFYRLLGMLWSRTFPFWRIRIEGRWPRERGPYVVVANHQSFLDIFLLCNVPHEMKWLAKEELFRIPMFGWGMWLVGDISLARGDTASAIAAMAKAKDYLAHGMSVIIFPEGTRSEDGVLLPFRPGAFKLAVEAGVPVLPIAVSGTSAGMPKGGLWVRPARLTARILEPVPTAGLTGRNVRKLRDEVRDHIAGALDQPLTRVPPPFAVTGRISGESE